MVLLIRIGKIILQCVLGLARRRINCRLAEDRLALVCRAESRDVSRIVQMHRPRFALVGTAGSLLCVGTIFTTVGGLVLRDDGQVGQLCSRGRQISAVPIQANVVAVLEAAKLNAQRAQVGAAGEPVQPTHGAIAGDVAAENTQLRCGVRTEHRSGSAQQLNQRGNRTRETRAQDLHRRTLRSIPARLQCVDPLDGIFELVAMDAGCRLFSHDEHSQTLVEGLMVGSFFDESLSEKKNARLVFLRFSPLLRASVIPGARCLPRQPGRVVYIVLILPSLLDGFRGTVKDERKISVKRIRQGSDDKAQVTRLALEHRGVGRPLLDRRETGIGSRDVFFVQQEEGLEPFLEIRARSVFEGL